jgi:hypothetical protein
MLKNKLNVCFLNGRILIFKKNRDIRVKNGLYDVFSIGLQESTRFMSCVLLLF